MKKLLCIIAALAIALTLSACRGGDVSKAQTLDWGSSAIYSDRDISEAIWAAKNYFGKYFEGCTLITIGYIGDDHADAFAQWAQQYDADQAIVLISSFDVDESGGDGSLNPGTTYKNWQWILVRNKGGSWKHATHGY